jgi:hypothetical protein
MGIMRDIWNHVIQIAIFMYDTNLRLFPLRYAVTHPANHCLKHSSGGMNFPFSQQLKVLSGDNMAL